LSKSQSNREIGTSAAVINLPLFTHICLLASVSPCI